MRSLAACLLILTQGIAVYWTARLALADRLFHLGTPAGLEAARKLAPGDMSYFQNDPRDRAALEHAVAQNPRYSRGWIELALLAEVEHDLARAERLLLAAARVDHTYEPSWALANFYFRREEWDKFWPWAHRAAEMTGYDQTPLFLLCWRASQDPALILTRAIPEQRVSLAQYLSFLLRQDKVEEAEPVGERLLAHSTVESVPLLLAYCDRLIRAERVEAAVRSWNTLCRRGLLPYRMLEPQQGHILTNGDFASHPLAAGFDWRVSLAEGVHVLNTGPPPALRISLSGSQPERLDLIAQVLPAEPSRDYRADYSWRTSGITGESGLRWRVTDFPGGRELASAPLQTSDGKWGRDSLTFPVPAGVTAVRLALEYRRAQGTTRIEGEIWLRQMSVSLK